jgi:hypothetical protein
MSIVRWFVLRGQKRGFLALVSAIVVLLLLASSAAAAGQVTGTLLPLDTTVLIPSIHYVGGAHNPSEAGVLYLQLDPPYSRKVAVYCIEANVNTFIGAKYQDAGTITGAQPPMRNAANDCKIRYLLNKYPASAVTTQVEGAARQLAVWHYTDLIDPLKIGCSSAACTNAPSAQELAVRARTVQIIQDVDANAPPCGTLQTSILSLTISPSAITVPIGQTQAFSLSAGPSAAGLTVNVSLSGPATLGPGGPAQGTAVLDGQGNATINVTPTGAGTVDVTASMPYQIDPGTVFNGTAANRAAQRLVLAEPIPLQATATLQTIIAPPTPTNTPGGAPTNTPTNTPPTGGGPTNTPTNTPPTGGGPTNTPTNTPPTGGGPTNTPTDTPSGPTITPGGPTITPGGPTNTPGGPTDTAVPTPPNAPDITPTSTHTPGKSKTATPETPGAPTATPEGTPTSPDGTPTSPDGTPTSPDGTPTSPDGTPGGGDITPGTGTGGAGGAGGAGLTDVKGQGQDSNVRPASLPRTGDGDSGLGQSILLIAALLLVGGTLLRRGGARR